MDRLTAALALVAALGVQAQTPGSSPKQPAPPVKQAEPVKKKAEAAKPPAASKQAAAAPVKKAAPAKKTATAAKASAARKRVVRRPVQQKPTPERYAEIQQALIGRGLLQGPATGVWGPDSVAALRSFQESQKLAATGKIDALSLIRLGLGPKTEAGLPPSDR